VRRWLERNVVESSARLQHFAEITTNLAKRELETEGGQHGRVVQHIA
jgi:hypothetical protein